MNIDEINQGIKTLPDMIRNNLLDYCKMCFAYLYELSYWGISFYDIYQICCGVATQDGKRSSKVIVSIIFYIFITILAVVIL